MILCAAALGAGALPLSAQVYITTGTALNPAPRSENTTFDYRVADGATLSFLNADLSLVAGGTGSGAVFSYAGSSVRSLSIQPDGPLDAPAGVRTGGGAAVFENNTAAKNGGAISIANNRVTLTLAGVAFAQNRALAGNGGALVTNGPSRVDRGVFTGNTASANGGAFSNTGSAWLTNMRFEGNGAGSNGGAIYNSTNSVTLSGGTFSTNTAGGSGGAVYTPAPRRTRPSPMSFSCATRRRARRPRAAARST